MTTEHLRCSDLEIIPGASSQGDQPWTADFTVMVTLSDGTRAVLFRGPDFGSFAISDEAVDAGREAAQKAIDGLARVTRTSDSVVAVDAMLTARERWRGCLHVASAGPEKTHRCIESDATREDALKRATALLGRHTPEMQ
jgi:hypothetical protein